MRRAPDIARQQIKLLEKAGVVLTLDQIAWLLSLGQRVEQPRTATNPLNGAVPVVAGCDAFFPLTCAAAWWLDITSDWWESETMQLYAMGFAHAVGRTAGAFDNALTPKAAVDAVAKWRQSCTCTIAEIAEAIVRLAANDAPDDGSEADFGDILAKAEGATGIPRREWETRGLNEAVAAILAAIEMHAASAGAEVDAAAQHSKQAFADLIRATEEIKAEWQTKQKS